MEFANVVRYGGKFYAISLQGAVAVMEVIDTRLKITFLGQDLGFSRNIWVQMEGEMLPVYLIHYESVEVVDYVEVFRLDLDTLDLIKAERLRGKTMFLKLRCDL